MVKEKDYIRENLLISASSTTSVQVGSSQWFSWLSDHQRFRFEGSGGHFYAQGEARRNGVYWYAYRRRGGRLCKLYLGKPCDLTRERLEQASLILAGQAAPIEATSTPSASTRMDALIRPPFLSGSMVEMPETSLSIIPLTRIRPPYLPEKLIARPRLTQLIKMPVTVIFAPSGYGKSTLLNEWRLTCGFPVAWVSIDEIDNQALRLWSTIGMALETIWPDFSQNFLSHLHAHSSTDLTQVVVGLINEIVRAAAANNALSPIGLVLDDYHRIQRPEIHAAIQTLLENLPTGLRLVISSHTRPPLAFGHLRAMGKVAELTIDDLRFTVEEGIDFLTQSPNVSQLSYNELQALVRHTEGWAAGLNLATLALAQKGSHNRLIDAFTGAHSYLREYFMESVLYQQPTDIQLFLLKTAILKQLCGPLCDAVVGRSGSSAILSQILQENLFLERLEEQNWFRYHDLFAEMLYSQLQVQFPAQIPQLHRRASEWYRTHNAPADAIYHLLAIQAWDEAASLIEHMALLELEQYGEDSRLLRWLQQLPEAMVQKHKTLLAVYIRLAGVALPEADVERFLARVEANITAKPIESRTQDELEVLSDARHFRKIIGTGGPVEAQPPAREENEPTWQLLNGLVAYQRNHCSDVDSGAVLARDVYESARTRHNLFVFLIAGGGYANLTLLHGFLRRSERIARQVLQQAINQRGSLPGPACFALTVLSQVCYERNELAQAHQLLNRAAEVDPNPTSTNASITAAILRAKIQAMQGNYAAARITLQAARELQNRQPSGVWIDQDLLAYQVLYRMRQAEGNDVELILGDTELTEPHPLSIYVRAEIYFRQGQYSGAEELLNHLLAQYPHGFYSEPIMGSRVLLALVLFEQNKFNQARQVITDAIRLAAPEAFIRPFIEQDVRLMPLLTLVLHTRNLTPEIRSFIKNILRLIEPAGIAGESIPVNNLEALSTAASITTREQEVLRMLETGLSNREIAGSLSISESTVKTHLGNIFYKLGVNNRIQAITQAQELNLV